MTATSLNPLAGRTAQDVMSRDLFLIPPEMSLVAAARLFSQAQIGGAPVVNAQGRCVGVLSATDLVRWASHQGSTRVPPCGLPRACSHQVKHREPTGEELTLCLLSCGVCPSQSKRKGAYDLDLVVCSEPRGICSDWQVVEIEPAPTDEVGCYMTANPVAVAPDTPLRDLARMMIDAHIHRIIIVDEDKRPVGLVSSTDIMGAVVYADADE